MSTLERLRRKMSKGRGRGQILVVVALAMLGLLVTAGLATDVGIIMMRKAQFDRAVDAAALAGAPLASQGEKTANLRGQQILAANGITVASIEPTTGTNPTYVCPMASNEDYCGETYPGNLPGSTAYKVEARWNVPLVFMQLLKFYSFTLTSSAEAVYYDTVDIFTSGNDQGLLQSSNLELFGPASCAMNGDAYSPDVLDTSGANNDNQDDLADQEYVFRIAIPSTYTNRLLRVELFDPQTGNLNWNDNGSSPATLPDPITSSSTYMPTSVLRVNGSNVAIGATNRCVLNGGGDARYDRRQPCLHGGAEGTTGAIDDPVNPFWYVRMDENRTAYSANPRCGQPALRTSGYYPNGSGYTGTINTTTRFQLYYYRQTSSGTLIKTFLSQYTGPNDNSSNDQGTMGDNDANALRTALKWVSPVREGGSFPTPAGEQMPLYSLPSSDPGVVMASPAEPRVAVDACPSPCSDTSNGDFIINLDVDDYNGQPGGEVEDIYEDPNSHVRHIYLGVKSMTGASENNWALWAGPARSEDASVTAPSFVNARQLYILRKKSLVPPVNVHQSKGIVTYGVGHLPMNSDSAARTKFPLAYIGPELAGANLTVRVWDADAGTNPPILFYFDTIPTADYSECWATAQTQCTALGGGSPTWQFNQIIGECDPVCFGDGATYGGSTRWGIFQFDLPTDADTTKPMVPFYGGRLYVDYQGGQQDSFGWFITVQARPFLTQ